MGLLYSVLLDVYFCWIPDDLETPWTLKVQSQPKVGGSAPVSNYQ